MVSRPHARPLVLSTMVSGYVFCRHFAPNISSVITRRSPGAKDKDSGFGFHVDRHSSRFVVWVCEIDCDLHAQGYRHGASQEATRPAAHAPPPLRGDYCGATSESRSGAAPRHAEQHPCEPRSADDHRRGQARVAAALHGGRSQTAWRAVQPHTLQQRCSRLTSDVSYSPSCLMCS